MKQIIKEMGEVIFLISMLVVMGLAFSLAVSWLADPFI